MTDVPLIFMDPRPILSIWYEGETDHGRQAASISAMSRAPETTALSLPSAASAAA